MVITEKNKGSHFFLEIILPNLGYMNFKILEKVEDELDVILGLITATSNVYKFEVKDKTKIIYMFSTATRKRKGQLNRLVEKNLLSKKLIEEYRIEGLLKKEFNEVLSDLRRKENFKLSSEPINFDGYKGNDLKIFKNKENWFEWQKETYEMLFTKLGTVKEPNSRKIISLYDPEGATGKSTFFKYLYFKHPDKIARISYATGQQLRSSLVNLSAYEIYIIDLVRTKSRADSYIDIISVLEDLKNGLVFNGMYGTGNTLMMEPPHIILSANFVPDVELLSKDRWEIYRIKRGKLVDITEKEINRQKEHERTKK